MIGKSYSRCRVLVIGPLPPRIPTRVNPIGGGPVNFAEMVRELLQRGVDLEIIDVNRPRTNVSRSRVIRRDLMKFVVIMWVALRKLKRNDLLFLNISAGRAWLAASFLAIVCRLAGRPMALRFFGGDFKRVYHEYVPLLRWWAEMTYLRSDLIFVQTEEIYNYFRNRTNFRWFPNTRDLRLCGAPARHSVTRILFFSRLYMDKGLFEAVEGCRNLPKELHLNVFGPVMPDTDFLLLEQSGWVTYRGVVDPIDVPKVLANHDVLLFPSYWASEGHPGVIIEALQCGLPVIATRWAGIPEIVEHGKSGLLVEPRSVSAVEAAIRRLISDPRLYRKLSAGARLRGEYFRSGRWYGRMAEDLEGLVQR